ncbi:hypothetical protein TCCBUS3UF1_13200 [Thermus sp. CCB_US3_UF1]|uniref:tripartite tricarboxylate transporter TctB family protein n=1 Tax=Thermus sp. CCB_US3_UF1 TaxID=1111069 RepID=UPI00023895DB|nr:tripartite tricarboxylate transporter TctB family protein [Thermus sp. CCB_US3_UF1]AEV16362.1 hypothetical protein TCCBUS3UF1_13200 [Thermus sp. CCB_US3_UF1]
MAWERWVGGLAAGLGLLTWSLSFSLPKAEGPGPELFPRVLGTVLVLGGFYMVWARPQAHPRIPKRAWPRVALFLLLFVLAPLLLPRLGVVSTTALVAGTGAFLAGEGWLKALLVALSLGLLTQWVFVRLLGVPA